MRIIKILGIRISIHLLFFPILLSLYIIGYGREILILMGIILIHELSHGLAAMILGIKIVEIQLLPIGGVVKLDKSLGFTLWEEIFISAAGPISNIVLSATVFFLQQILELNDKGLDFIIFSSLFIGVFNIIPALPLDGGRIFRAILSFLFGYKRATRMVVWISRMVALGLIGFNGYLFYIGSHHFTLSLVGLFVWYQSQKENEIAIYTTMRDIVAKKENLNKQGSMESQHITVLPKTTLGEIFKQFSPKKFHIIYVLDEKYALKGIVTEDEVLSAIIKYGMHQKVKIILEKRKEY